MSTFKNLEDFGFKNYCIDTNGNVYNLKSDRFVKQHLTKKGYYRVGMICDNSVSKTCIVHRLVALAFIPTNDISLEVNHKDGDKKNNNVDNLEWVTSLENIQHAVTSGLRDVHYKYTDDDVHLVCNLLEQGYRNVDVANMTGMSKSHISGIKTGRYYPEIVAEYEIGFVKKADRIGIDKVQMVCEMLQQRIKDYQISKDLCINHRIVGMIRKRLTHTGISRNYQW